MGEENVTEIVVSDEKKPKPAVEGRLGEKTHRNLLVLFLVGLAALGLMLWRVDKELAGLTQTLSHISESVRSSKAKQHEPKVETLVAQDVIKAKSGALTFVQRCDGKMDVGDGDVPFCVGENVLSVSKDGAEPVEIDRRTAASAKDAPVLAGLTLVAGSDNVLVSYGATRGVSMAVDAASLSARTLANYPAAEGAEPHWNAEGARLALVPAAGTIVAYDLAKDAVRELAKPADGQTGWTGFAWTSADEYVVNAVDAKGKTTEVKGKME